MSFHMRTDRDIPFPRRLLAALARAVHIAGLGGSRLFPIILALMLAACMTPEQRAEDMATYINANYGLTCEKLGYQPGSDQHRNCMLSMYNTDQTRIPAGWGAGWGRRW
jgi:hypothetical protein